MKKIIFVFFVILWLVIIFMFSNANNSSSNGLSYSISGKIITVTNRLHITNISDNDRMKVVKKINKPLRKLAHMTEYFILAFLVYNLLKAFDLSNKKVIITLILCFIYSLCDEYHQTFIIGRTGQFIDCIIDSCGSLLYLIIIYFKNTRKKI